MKRYFAAIREELPGISERDLLVPLEESGIDSVDLVYIRALLENRIDEMDNGVWDRFGSVGQAVEYCIRKEQEQGIVPGKRQRVQFRRTCNIGMPQMANGCLSENWLFKELGDLHWALLCKGLQTRSADLKDANGDRLYATFVRIQTVHHPLSGFRENEVLCLEGSIKRFGSNTYISGIFGRSNNKVIEATLMTAFSTRVEGDNARLFKSTPVTKKNKIPEYLFTPAFLSSFRMVKKELLGCLEVSGITFRITNEIIYETVYDINPYYEINGVGLLYFAAYPVISDVCEARYFNEMAGESKRWENRYDVGIRDIFYFANCNAADKIIYRLNRYESLPDGRVILCSSLYRQHDEKLMCQIFTVKVRRR